MARGPEAIKIEFNRGKKSSTLCCEAVQGLVPDEFYTNYHFNGVRVVSKEHAQDIINALQHLIDTDSLYTNDELFRYTGDHSIRVSRGDAAFGKANGFSYDYDQQMEDTLV